jgi:hypothetical protein
MVQQTNGERLGNAFLNATNSHVSIVEWKATQLTTYCHAVLGVKIMKATFNACVTGVIHQKAVLIAKIPTRVVFLIARGHP